MKPLFLTALALGLGAGQTLSTDYGRDRSLSVSVVSKTETETTASVRTIDGEPQEGRGGFGGGNTSIERSYSYADTVLEAKDAAPKKVKRVFGEVGGSMTMPSREGGEQEMPLESAFSGATVVIDATGAETKFEVLEGKLEDEQLAGLVPTLALDRLLPGEEVEEGATWELEGADVLAAVGHELERNLFRRAAPPEGGGGEGRGGRGPGGGMSGRMGGFATLESGEWDAKGKLTDETEEVDGVECAVVTYEIEVSGELPEMGAGGRGRDRAFGLAAAPLANTFEAELKGRLLWSTKEARPVKFTLTGTMETVRDFERETERGVSKTHIEQETRFDLTVDVTAGPKAE